MLLSTLTKRIEQLIEKDKITHASSQCWIKALQLFSLFTVSVLHVSSFALLHPFTVSTAKVRGYEIILSSFVVIVLSFWRIRLLEFRFFFLLENSVISDKLRAGSANLRLSLCHNPLRSTFCRPLSVKCVCVLFLCLCALIPGPY